MTEAQDKLLQGQYTRARLMAEAPQPSFSLVKYLRHRLDDPHMDIRRRRFHDGRVYSCFIRWVPPRVALGKLGMHIGMMRLPTIVSVIRDERGWPREPTYRDVDNLALITHESTRMALEAAEKAHDKSEQDAKNIDQDFKREVRGHHSHKGYLAIANENRRRIASGEVEGYGWSGEERDGDKSC